MRLPVEEPTQVPKRIPGVGVIVLLRVRALNRAILLVQSIAPAATKCPDQRGTLVRVDQQRRPGVGQPRREVLDPFQPQRQPVVGLYLHLKKPSEHLYYSLLVG